MSNLKKSEENEKLRITLLTALNKMNSSSTIKVCHETIKKLITDEEKNENRINFILNTISDHINHLQKGEKKESIKLLAAVCSAIKDVSAYLSRLLTIIQTNITEENSAIFTAMSTTFGEIVDYTTNKSEEKSNMNYELLQGFCIYNMKIEKKTNQICGSLCLTALIENSAMVLEPAYMKYIWENIIYFIDKSNFHAKSELINSLISLIFASENLFKPFATVTLYKILDFLTDGDWLKRKLALNVVYTLVIYAQEEIVPLKGHIVEFLKVLKCDKIKEVREVCMQTLKLFNNTIDDEEKLDSDEDCEDENEGEVKLENIRENVEKNVKKVMEKVDLIAETPKSSNKMTLKESIKSPVFKQINSNKILENEISKIEKKSVNASKFDFDNSNLNDLICDNDFVTEERKINRKKTSQPAKKIVQDRRKSVGNKNVNGGQFKSEFIKTTTKNPSQTKTQKVIANKNNSYFNTTNKVSDKSVVERLETVSPNNKKDPNINRNTDNNTFVNTKMNIKRDPKRSIFKTQANRDFFSKAKNGDIQILYKEQSKTISRSRNEDEEVVLDDSIASRRESKLDLENYSKKIEDPLLSLKPSKSYQEKEFQRSLNSIHNQSKENSVKHEKDEHLLNDNFKLSNHDTYEDFEFNSENIDHFTEINSKKNLENNFTLAKKDSLIKKVPSENNINKKENLVSNGVSENTNNHAVSKKESFSKNNQTENTLISNYFLESSKKESSNHLRQIESDNTDYVQIKKKESSIQPNSTNQLEKIDNSNKNYVQIKKKENLNQKKIISQNNQIDNKNVNNIELNKNESYSQLPQPENTNFNFSQVYKKNILPSTSSPIFQPKQIELSDILRQMKSISEKQIFLVDTIDKTQESTKDQFEKMNKRIIYLENTVNQLLSYIAANNIQQQPYNTSSASKNPFNTKKYETKIIKKDEAILDDSLTEDNTPQLNNIIKQNVTSNNNSNYTTKRSSRIVDIYAELQNKNPNEAFNIALNCPDETNLIKLIEKVTISQIKDTDDNIIEDAVIRLVSLLLRGENSNLIIPFLKNVIVIAEVSLKASLIQNIRDILLHIPNNKQKYNLTNDEMIDINLILTHINTKASKLIGYSTLIQSFAADD